MIDAERYIATNRLTTRLMTEAFLDSINEGKWLLGHPLAPAIRQAHDRLNVLASRFHQEVWNNGGMGQEYHDLPDRGVETPIGNDVLMVWSAAGRVLITIQAPNGDHITFITDDNPRSEHLGIQGIDATEDEASRLIQHILDCNAAGGLGLWPNKNVRMAGL